MSRRAILFTGSLGLETEDAAFRALAAHIGPRAKRYPDGEPGSRQAWIGGLVPILAAHPQLEKVGIRETFGEFEGKRGAPKLAPKPGIAPEDLEFDGFGYAGAAIASYAKFMALRDAGTIPAGTRFQVSLPTAVPLLVAFIDEGVRLEVEPAVERGLMNDVAAIAAAIPPDDLAVQWDVCHEVVGHDGGAGLWALHYADTLAGGVERVCRLLGAIPEGAEAGVHLCYGDPDHHHIVEPQSLAACVAFANGICANAPRHVDWIHMPVPRERDDDAYFAPLDGLQLAPGTELYLGLVHHTDGVEGTRRRLAAAEKHTGEFGIATECGFGRRPRDTIEPLLDIHARVADGT